MSCPLPTSWSLRGNAWQNQFSPPPLTPGVWDSFISCSSCSSISSISQLTGPQDKETCLPATPVKHHVIFSEWCIKINNCMFLYLRVSSPENKSPISLLSFTIGTLKNYLINEWRRMQKVGGGGIQFLACSILLKTLITISAISLCQKCQSHYWNGVARGHPASQLTAESETLE